jgi:predicted AAA+ superfamily ATPase
LARAIAKQEKGIYFDLEDPRDLQRLEQAQTVLESLEGIVVLDEIHRRADLMPLLRVLADRRPVRCRFLVLGSASPDLMRGAAETLAGRIRFVDMGGLTLTETGLDQMKRLWIRGGFPDSFLAKNEATSQQWREDFIKTFLERDLPQLGFRFPALTMRRFWTMLAHYHGQIWNGSELGASLGVSHHATRRY